MSKPRKTPVPLPGSKSKTPASKSSSKKTPIPIPTSKSPKEKTQLSSELVGDSDESSDEVTETPKETQEKASINIAVHRPKANGVAKPATEAKKKQKDPPKKATKEAVVSRKPAPKQVTTEEEGASTSSSEESSDDAETDIKQAQQREAQRKQKEDSDSSSEDSSDESEEEAAPVAQRAEPRPAQSQSQTVTFQQARPYVPPDEFKAASTERAASSANANIFKNLNGKQIWHITAPKNVSLQDLTKLAMDKAKNGEAVLDYKGASYGFSPAEIGAGEREVMIPVANGYKAAPAKISQSFNMHQVINLPKLTSKQADQNTGSEAAASITASTIRSVKPQAKGLKMRFFPSGFEDSAPTTLGDSDDEEDAPAPAGLGVPVGFDPPARKEKKRKHEQSNAGEEAESSAKKHKKHKSVEVQQHRDEKKAKKDKKKEKKSKS